MPRAIDAYRKGYEKGRTDDLGGRLAEATMGIGRDDPGGHFAAGYYDGAAGKKFNPPSGKDDKSPRQEPAGPPAPEWERSWYRFCDSSEFIPKAVAQDYARRLREAGANPVAYTIGLHDFYEQSCPKCGAVGHFKGHLFGEVKHPDCETHWYVSPGSYIAHQIAAIYHSGVRAGASMKDDADRKGDKSGGCIYAVFGFVFVAVLRAALAVLLIPIQAIVSLTQAKSRPSGAN
jgi:hypothetical protein